MGIREGKLIYHLTDIRNIESIIRIGLLSRKRMVEKGLCFEDVADREILQFREEYDLNQYVPFHFFARNPFDGKVQKCNPESEFVYLCMLRECAKNKGFQIIPRHPLNMEPFIMYNYDEGMDVIEWDKMEQRDYSNYECKEICMAECVYQGELPVGEFFSINVKTEVAKRYVENLLKKYGIKGIYVNFTPYFFVGD